MHTRRADLVRLRAAVFTALLPLIASRTVCAQTELLGVEPVRRVAVGGGNVVALSYSSRGDSLIVITQSGRVVAMDARSGVTGAEFRVSGRPVAVARSRDDSRLVVGVGSEIIITDVSRGERRQVKIGEDVTSLSVSPTGATIAVGTRGGTVVLISGAMGDILGRLRGSHNKAVVHLAFTGTGGEALLSVGEDRTIAYWDVKRLERLRQITDPEPKIVSAAGSPAGDLLFIGTESFRQRSMSAGNVANDVTYTNLLRTYDVASAAPQKSLDLSGRAALGIAVAPNCKYVVATVRGIRGSQLVAFDLDRGVSVLDLPLDGRAAAIAFASDGRSLAVGNDAGDVSLYRVTGVEPRPRCVADLRGTKFAITGLRAPLVKPSRRVRFAVLDFDDNGVGPEVTRAIADQLTTRLGLNPAIRLVERRRIAAILKEQTFQQSGRTDPQTAIQLARILNVQKVLMGAVAKLGTTMTITVQMVDVETAAIDGSREVQCRACELEDLTQAVSELSTTVVAEPDASVLSYPEPPVIKLDYPREGGEVSGSSVVVRGTIQYARPIEGVELLVNGHPVDASRLLDRGGSKMTRFPDGTSAVAFVQEVPLEQVDNLIAVRAVGADGNDEQRYVAVKRTSAAPAKQGTPPIPTAEVPGIALDELEFALRSRVPTPRLLALTAKFGLGFDIAMQESKLRAAGADASLLTALRKARRTDR